jgi:hypothetical protein
MAIGPTTTLVAAWGAGLSTLLASIKIWEIWRDRFRLEVSHSFTSSESIGNDVLIRNLSARPIIISYWELLYCTGRWPRRKFQSIAHPDYDDGDSRLEPHTTETLHFANENYFASDLGSLNGRRIYIRIHVAGRKPVLRLIYPRSG